MHAYLKNNNQVIQEIAEMSIQNLGGNQRKWTGLVNNKRVYIKTSSSERGKVWYECESECIASRLAIAMGIPQVINYYLDTLVLKNKEYKVCVSYDFVCSGEFKYFNSIAPYAFRLSGEEKYRYIVSQLPQLKSRIDTILLFDSIIGNEDRHLRNLGIVQTACLGYYIPLFDCGNSMFYNKSQKYIQTMLKSDLDLLPCKPFYSTHQSQLRLCDLSSVQLKPVYKEQVYRIVNSFYTGERAKLICKFLISRLRRYNLLWN